MAVFFGGLISNNIKCLVPCIPSTLNLIEFRHQAFCENIYLFFI